MEDATGAPPAPSTTPPAGRALDQRLLFVLGKGGVGRTTAADALGLLYAHRGARTIIAELGGHGELLRAFGRPPSDSASPSPSDEVEVSERLYSVQIEPQRALAEYLHQQLPLRVLADLFGATRTLGFLAAATPGLAELLSAGKIWELAQPERIIPNARPYDRVIVDAPASGHSLALLAAPQAFARTARTGPIARQAGRIGELLLDRAQTALLAVATPEDAAVSELLELQEALRRELSRELDAVLVNAMPAARFEAGDARALESALATGAELSEDARAALAQAIAEDRELRAARTQVERLASALPGTPLIELPFSYSAEFAAAELQKLADGLGEVL
jgi:anion-transporting  ArsA/GET3 family ATPase